MESRVIKDQLRKQISANKKALKLIDRLKNELLNAEKETTDVKKRINFWIEYVAWLGNSLINPDGGKFVKNKQLTALVEQLSRKEMGMLASIIQHILNSDDSLDATLYQLIEKQSPDIINTHYLQDFDLITLNMN